MRDRDRISNCNENRDDLNTTLQGTGASEEKIKPPKGLDPWEVLFVSEHTALEILLVPDPIGIPDLIGFWS